jgi:hypothetical protein
MLPRQANELLTVSETIKGIQCMLGKRKEEPEIGEVDEVAPALQTIVQPQ